MQQSHSPRAPITIKKYANRRLYNTATSSYVTLDNLAAMVKAGVDFTVFDAKTGEDITRSVLTQIIVEEESKGRSLLPEAFLRHLIGFQFEMLASQRAHLPSHPYQSDWWQWPLMLRPIWYLFAKSGSAYQAVLLVGNPVIYWGGALMAAISLSGWLKRRDTTLLVLTGVYIFSLAIWIVIPKSIGFFYYYNLSAVDLCLLSVAFLRLLDPVRGRWLIWFTGASLLAFVYFYPIIAAQPLPTDNTWTDWVWMKSWY